MLAFVVPRVNRYTEGTVIDLAPIYRCAVGLDVHQSQLTLCVLHEGPSGEVVAEVREFGSFKRDRRALAEWVAGFQPDVAVMESTAIYWKSPYARERARRDRVRVPNRYFENSIES